MTEPYQLHTPIPVLTPKGRGWCFAWIDYSQEHSTLWKCCITDTGEWWDVPQEEIRGVRNWSMQRRQDGKTGHLVPTADGGGMAEKITDPSNQHVVWHSLDPRV